MICMYKENNIIISMQHFHDKNVPESLQSKAEKFIKIYQPNKIRTAGSVNKVLNFGEKTRSAY